MTDDNRISELYQQGKEQGPPVHLDDAILNMAKEAVQTETVASKANGPFSGGWPMAASIAAVLIVTVILVPLLQQEEPSLADKKIMNNPASLMMEQDARKQTVFTERFDSERMEANTKSKKRIPVLELQYKTERKLVRPNVREADELPVFAITPTLSRESEPSIQSGAAAIMADDFSEAVLKPAEWLEEIRQLVRQNKLDQARNELIEFKKYYPDEEVNVSIPGD